ncbi:MULTISPECIES: phage protease [Serratia]|uniref:phage protease n=1 Tax=Serratia TaxID=613 RepID=UPI00065FC828|nr:phage protease [Serratia sp. 506_PEND]
MKTHTPPQHSLRHTATAALSATLAQSDDGWCQLLPAGRVKARDGRPEKPAAGWLINQAACQRIKANLAALKQPLLIDYDHHSEIAQQAGVKALAAGWVKPENVAWREGQGIFIKPEWTPAAQAHIDNREYAYLSARLEYYLDTGEPAAIRIASLTNDPAITGMNPVATLSAGDLIVVSTDNLEQSPMNEHLRRLLAALGLTVPDDGEFTDAIGTAALSALTTLQTQADAHDDLKTQVATLSSELTTARQAAPTGGAVDLTQYVPADTYNALRTEYAALSARLGTSTLEQVLDKAEQDGRVLKSERTYLEQLGGQIGVAALSAQLEARPPITALTTLQTSTITKPATTETTALSAEDLLAAKLLGKSEDEFRKAKEEFK